MSLDIEACINAAKYSGVSRVTQCIIILLIYYSTIPGSLVYIWAREVKNKMDRFTPDQHPGRDATQFAANSCTNLTGCKTRIF